MILNKQLQVLIESSLAQGRDYEDIRSILLKQGFKDDDISDIFSQYRGGGSLVNNTKKEEVQNDFSNVSQAQKSVGQDVEQFLNVGTNTQTAKDLLLKEQSKFQSTPEIKVVGEDFGIAGKVNRGIQAQQYINVGLSGIPEIENVLAEEKEKKIEKSIAPMVIILVLVIAMIGGFFYWLLVLKDGGASIINDKVSDQELGELNQATNTKPDIKSGEVDPFTGEVFKVE